MCQNSSLRIIILIIHLVNVIQGQGPSCTGQTLGEENPDGAVTTAGTNSGTSNLLRGDSMAIPCCGSVSGFRFGAATSGDVTAQIWKPVGGDAYGVVGEKLFSGVTAGSSPTAAPDTPISVEQGYKLGWYSTGPDVVGYETDASYAMGIVNSAGKTNIGGQNTWSSALVDGQHWHIGVTLAPNSVPYFTSLPANATALTSDAAGTVVHTLGVMDDDPDDVADLSININPASAEFEIVGNNVQIKSAPLAVQDYIVVIEVVDHCLQTGTSTLTVQVTDNGLEVISLPVAAPYELMEDTEIETLLHTLAYTDVDTPLEDITCRIDTILPSDPGSFFLRHIPNSIQNGIYFVPNSANHLDYDVTPTYYIDVICNDGTSDSDTALFQVDIVPNPAPVPTIPPSVTIDAELTKAGVVFQTITATDASTHPDGSSDTLTFTMDNGGCPFAMDSNGEIYATEDLNTYRTTPCIVNINVTDSYEGVTYNTVGPTPMTIHITNINHPPNITNPSVVLPDIDNVYVFEHTDEADPWAIGTTISVFTPAGVDEDGDDLTWEMEFVNGLGEEYFQYDPDTGKITTTQDLDYETLSRNGLLQTQVDIRVYDQREYSEWRRFNIFVDDVNETPEFDQTVYHIETLEGQDVTVNLDCPGFTVTDEDLYDTRTYDIDCGGIGIFKIASARTPSCDAIIQQTAERDLDALGLESEDIECTINVYDKLDLVATTQAIITVHEDNDNPPVLSQSSFVYTITNDSVPDLTFGSFSSTDIDIKEEHQIVTYTTDSSEFIADANGAFVNTKDWTGVNAPLTRTFTLTATDKAGNTDTATVTVHIVDVPDPTTTTAPATTIPATYDAISSFLDDPGNFAWMIAALLLGLAMLGLMAYMCFRCCRHPGACLNTCRGGGSRSCFGRGGRSFRGSRWFGRKTVVKRAPKPKRVVSKTRKIRVIEERERQPVRVVEKRKPVKVIEEEKPVKVIEKTPKVVEEPPVKEPVVNEPVKEVPTEKKSSFFDRFKSKPKPPAPKASDNPKEWHLWGESDFMSNDKWVG